MFSFSLVQLEWELNGSTIWLRYSIAVHQLLKLGPDITEFLLHSILPIGLDLDHPVMFLPHFGVS